MKTKLFLPLLVLSSMTFAKESNEISCIQTVTIPDPLFKSIVVTKYDTNGDGEICEDEAKRVTGELNVSSQGVKDLTGIEYFVNITKLNCENNVLNGKVDLSHNVKLKTLLGRGANINSLDVRHCTELEQLDISNNPITFIDLRQNAKLKELSCEGTALKSIDTSHNPLLVKNDFKAEVGLENTHKKERMISNRASTATGDSMGINTPEPTASLEVHDPSPASGKYLFKVTGNDGRIIFAVDDNGVFTGLPNTAYSRVDGGSSHDLLQQSIAEELARVKAENASLRQQLTEFQKTEK